MFTGFCAPNANQVETFFAKAIVSLSGGQTLTGFSNILPQT